MHSTCQGKTETCVSAWWNGANCIITIKDGSTVLYGTERLDFLLRSSVHFFCNGMVRFFVMVQVRHNGMLTTLCELKIPDFSHVALDFCMQR